MIKEGDIIRLTISGESTSPMGEKVYIAAYKTKKFLLNNDFFANTSISLNQEIDCYVEKVNCSGKIYISPLANRSLIGQTQTFKILQKKSVVDSLGVKKYLYKLQNLDRQKAEILSYTSIDIKEVDCTIIDIRKHQLTVVSSVLHDHIYHTYQPIEVEIIEERTLPLLGKSWIIQDKNNKLHPISIEKFQHYKLRIGSNIRCSILGFDKSFNLKLEPQNPFYTVGEIYDFKTIRIDESQDVLGNTIKLLFVMDQLGKEASIVQLPKNYEIQPFEKAKVYRINNGRLYLEYFS